MLGQHLAALVDVGHGAGDLAEQATTSVAQVNVESLRVVNGVIDVDAIEVLERPFGDTNAALQRMSAVLASARSPWLVAPVGDRRRPAGRRGRRARRADRPRRRRRCSWRRRCSGATARARTSSPSRRRPRRVGSAGSWARGRSCAPTTAASRSSAPVRPSELTGAMRAAPPVLDGPADYLARYGRFGAGVDGEPVAIDFWSNVTMSPDFPSVTEVFAQLYPASGGTRDRRRHRRRRRVDRPVPRAHRSGAGRGTGRDDPADVERRRAVPAARPVRRDRRRRRRATPCSRRSRRS